MQHSIMTDILSSAANQILQIDAPSAYRSLVVAGKGNLPARQLLEGIGPLDLFTAPPQNLPAAQAALAGMWLWHDWLHESHTIAQQLPDATGSFWHAIMHRREGDFSNSKYWYARSREHPALRTLAERAPAVVQPSSSISIDSLMHNGLWQPERFVDHVEANARNPQGPAHERVVVQLQQLEWQTLFSYTIESADK